VLDGQWVAAEGDLSRAFQLCDKSHMRNTGTILSYLVPVRILRGVMPTDAMLEKYNLGYFSAVVAALKKGDPAEVEAALDAERVRFMRARSPLLQHCLPDGHSTESAAEGHLPGDV
jgi:hypothetical protein